MAYSLRATLPCEPRNQSVGQTANGVKLDDGTIGPDAMSDTVNEAAQIGSDFEVL